MATKRRSPMQVSPRFIEKLKEFKIKAMNERKDPSISLAGLTDEIASNFDEIEKILIKKSEPQIEFRVKFDRRLL